MRVAISVVALVIAFAGRAWAGPSAAEVAFDKGRALRKAGQWAEAKAAFEESQKLEPKNGTRFNIAECDEHLGKLASALAVYRDLAANDTRAERKAATADLVRQLEPRVPKLQIKLDPPAADAKVTLNGAPLPALNVPVDFGEYTVAATAPGYEPGSATASVSEEGRTIVVTVRMVPKAAVVVPAATTKAGMAGRKKGAIAMFALGAVALGVGGFAGLSASSTWDDAKAICGGSTTCATEADAARANELGSDAKTAGYASTALIAVGVAAVATGVVLWVTSPRRERAVAVGAAPTSDGFAVAIGGRF